jgi:hypothetical protein
MGRDLDGSGFDNSSGDDDFVPRTVVNHKMKFMRRTADCTCLDCKRN